MTGWLARLGGDYVTFTLGNQVFRNKYHPAGLYGHISRNATYKATNHEPFLRCHLHKLSSRVVIYPAPLPYESRLYNAAVRYSDIVKPRYSTLNSHLAPEGRRSCCLSVTHYIGLETCLHHTAPVTSGGRPLEYS